MRPIVIEGHKGAGKTPLISAMKKTLENGGIKYKIAEPWQAAIKEFRIDPYYLFTDPNRAKEIVNFLSLYINDSYDSNDSDSLLIYDRQWLTFLTSMTLINPEKSNFTKIQYEILFSKLMKNKPITFFIASTPSILKNRRSRKGPPPWNEDLDYWTRLILYNRYRSLFSKIYWVRKSRIDMSALASDILFRYYNKELI